MLMSLESDDLELERAYKKMSNWFVKKCLHFLRDYLGLAQNICELLLHIHGILTGAFVVEEVRESLPICILGYARLG